MNSIAVITPACAALALLFAAVSASAAEGLLALTDPTRIHTDAAWRFDFSTRLFVGSDFAKLKGLLDDGRLEGYAPRSGKNLAIVSARVANSADWSGWRLGWIYRQEWLAETARKTLDVYRSQKFGASAAVGEVSAVDYRLRGFSAQGLQLAKALDFVPAPQWLLSGGAALSLLRGGRMRDETWSGSATTSASAPATVTYNNLDIVRTYTGMDTVANNFTARYQAGSSEGGGYAVDLGLRLLHADGLELAWVVNDAVSDLRWSQVPQITLRASSSVYDGSFPEGKKWRVDWVEKPPVKQQFSLALPVSTAWRVELTDTLIADSHLPQAGIGGEVFSGWQARLDYDLRFKTLGLGLQHGGFEVDLRSDTPRLGSARAVGVHGALNLSW